MNRPNQKPLEIVCSRYFLNWLAMEKISLVFTTYQSCRLFFLGVKPDGSLSAFERLFDKAMGLHATPERLYMSTRYQVWQMDNILQKGEVKDGYDRLYVPRVAYTTGDIDTHDIVVDGKDKVYFVNTLYSCVGSLSQRYSFIPEWKPSFISRLAPEDRCHLNGLAMRDGKPRYATSVSMSDMFEGWRDKRIGGGCVVDMTTDEIIATGLSMPHSPRFYRDRLWVCNSGEGDFGYVDMEKGRFEPVIFCQGYLRGLAFHKNYAIAGLSKPRHERTFSGLPLDGRLAQKHTDAICGFMIIDLNTGEIVHWVRLEGVTTELYDVQVLEGVQRPMSLGIKSDEICRTISIPPWTKMEIGAANTFLGASSIGDMAAGSGSQPQSFFAKKTQPQMPEKSGGGYKFTIFGNLKPEEVLRYEQFLFPDIKKQWLVQKPAGKLLAVVADFGRKIAGAAVAELNPADNKSRILSLFVIPEHRNKKIGSQLLSLIEEGLRKAGCRRMEIFFRSDWKYFNTIRKLLNELDWLPPQIPRILCRTTIDSISKCPWLDEVQLPEGFALFPWSELTPDDREYIFKKDREENGWFPAELTPFQEEERMEYINSLGLRYSGDVAGWMHTHRTNPDTIQYSSLFVDEALRNKKLAIAVVAESINRQVAAGVPDMIFMVDSANRPMLNFVKQRLEKWLTNITEYNLSIKKI